ncbi:hypothetical protein PCL_03353 [Purpureocillium lilacinum]|uniref:Uncharacterized protein n=1 Tax=Purpureocillium lilacinum TaxID=33203 RepID=A0A2U3ENS5_PURLI|nr:hypothetical protein PCL_03353 [Purpureocillium lilacinum]
MILPGPRCKQTEPGRKHQVQREHAVAGRVGKVGSIKPAGPAGTRGLSRGPDWELMGGPRRAWRRETGRWEKFRWVESRGGMEGGHDDSSYGSLRGHVGTVLTGDVPPLGGRGADGVLEVPVVRRRALALRGSRSVPQWSGGSPGSPGQRWGAGTRRTPSWRALAEEALSRLRVAGRDFAHGRRCKRPQGKMYMPPRSPEDTRPDALGRPTPGSQQHHWLKRARQWLAQRAVAVGAQALCAVLCFPPFDLRHVPERKLTCYLCPRVPHFMNR